MEYDLPILEKKIKKLNNYIAEYEENGSINEINLYESINDVLAWIEISIRLLDRKKISESDIEMIDAIVYANNLRKHIPFSTDRVHENSNKIKYENYKKFLEEKEIHETIKQVLNIIKKSII